MKDYNSRRAVRRGGGGGWWCRAAPARCVRGGRAGGVSASPLQIAPARCCVLGLRQLKDLGGEEEIMQLCIAGAQRGA